MSDRPSRFDVLNRVVDGGHVATMGRSELAAWLVLFRYADGEDTAAVGIDKLAIRMGVHARNAARTIARMAGKGLAKRQPSSGGRGHAATTRLTVPAKAQTPAHRAPLYAGETPALADTKPRRWRTLNPGAGEHVNPGAVRRVLYIQNPEQTLTDTTEGRGGVVDGVEAETDKADALAVELRALGIRMTTEEARGYIPGLWPIELRLAYLAAAKNPVVKNLAAWIGAEIRGERLPRQPLIDPDLAKSLMNNGHVVRILGRGITAAERVRSNGAGLYFPPFGEVKPTIRFNLLTPDAFELSETVPAEREAQVRTWPGARAGGVSTAAAGMPAGG